MLSRFVLVSDPQILASGQLWSQPCKLALKARILRVFWSFEATKLRNLRAFVARALEKQRFGCILGSKMQAKPWFWGLGGSQTTYFTRVLKGSNPRNHVKTVQNACSGACLGPSWRPSDPLGALRGLPGALYGLLNDVFESSLVSGGRTEPVKILPSLC